ncbi:hypothetical protein [Trichloromonas sp.]|uniref:hypothetical protein n=1 Tax=Trichloromonas sp. TaxID=3069249 RepID=UPI002A3F217F|nr:hypothetical protein [Trichloromonas sp.]
MILRMIFLSALLLMALPALANPLSAVTCHCFTDRSYDAARPEAADAYYLAATQNTFFAKLFKTEKKLLVRGKQKGMLMEDFWVAHYVAGQAKSSAETLLKARYEHPNWSATLAAQEIDGQSLEPFFTNALASEASGTRLDRVIVDELLPRHGVLNKGDIAPLRQAGLENQELLMVALLAKKSGQTAQAVAQGKSATGKSWSALFHEAGIDIARIDSEIDDLLRHSG